VTRVKVLVVPTAGSVKTQEGRLRPSKIGVMRLLWAYCLWLLDPEGTAVVVVGGKRRNRNQCEALVYSLWMLDRFDVTWEWLAESTFTVGDMPELSDFLAKLAEAGEVISWIGIVCHHNQYTLVYRAIRRLGWGGKLLEHIPSGEPNQYPLLINVTLQVISLFDPLCEGPLGQWLRARAQARADDAEAQGI